MQPQPHLPSIVPSVVLIINQSSSGEEAQSAKKSSVIAAELCDLGMPATWVIEEVRQAGCLVPAQLAVSSQEVALTATGRSPQRLRSELSRRQAAVEAMTGQIVSVIAGDPQQLRARAGLLAELGIHGVVATSQNTALANPPRLLPCGVWQLNSTPALPPARRRWSLVPRRRITAARLLAMASAAVGQPVAVEIDLSRLAVDDLPSCQQLLQEVAAALRQQKLAVATVSQVVGQLASQRQVKPQRSILRQAA